MEPNHALRGYSGNLDIGVGHTVGFEKDVVQIPGRRYLWIRGRAELGQYKRVRAGRAVARVSKRVRAGRAVARISKRVRAG